MDENEKVRILRKLTGLSQEKFGRYFRISASNIQKWEQNVTHPPEYLVYMMARILCLDPKMYVGDKIEKEIPGIWD